jgi:hypothetical protein
VDAESVHTGAQLYFTINHILITGTALNSLRNDACFLTLLSAVFHRCIHAKYYRKALTGPEGSRRLRLPDFKKFGR